MNRKNLRSYAAVLVYGLALALVLFCAFSCTSMQYQRWKAHTAATGTAGIFGAGATALGGPIGLVVFGGGVLLGVIIDQTLEPEPEVRTRTVTTTVQVPPPEPDGTPAKPIVHTYVDKDPHAAPASVGLPGGLGDLANKLTWSERLWRAIQIAWWVFVGLAVLSFVIVHKKARAVLVGCIASVFIFGWDKLVQGLSLLRSKLKPPTPPAGG